MPLARRTRCCFLGRWPSSGQWCAAWFGWPDVPKLEAQRLSWFDAPYLPTGQYFASTAWRRSTTEPVSEVMAFWGVQPT
jgi:hypothetical protein